MLKLFKKGKGGNRTNNPPDYNEDSSRRYNIPIHELMIRIDDINRELEDIGPNTKKGKLPAYETEKDHHLRKMMDNYGPGGGIGGGFGSPKLPVIPPREKKPKREKPPTYPL
jgi:hypothetical protein